VPLDNVGYGSLRVRPGGLQELDSVNQTLVVPNEFEDVQREFPILIRKDDQGQYLAVALLGLDKGENLFLDNDRWITRYVPAVNRRGPFFLAEEKADDPSAEPRFAVHIDLDDPRVGEDAGQPLFRDQGGTTPYLDQVTRTLHVIREGLAAQQPMFALLDELDLLQPLGIEIRLNDGKNYNLPGFQTIGAEQFQKLSGNQLERLSKSGFLAATIFIRSSLPNMSRLIELKNRKLAAGSDTV
jgi:hypothetical protein